MYDRSPDHCIPVVKAQCTTIMQCIDYFQPFGVSDVTLPEWLTGSPAKRLGFARVCSNRTGDGCLCELPFSQCTEANANGKLTIVTRNCVNFFDVVVATLT